MKRRLLRRPMSEILNDVFESWWMIDEYNTSRSFIFLICLYTKRSCLTGKEEIDFLLSIFAFGSDRKWVGFRALRFVGVSVFQSCEV